MPPPGCVTPTATDLGTVGHCRRWGRRGPTWGKVLKWGGGGDLLPPTRPLSAAAPARFPPPPPQQHRCLLQGWSLVLEMSTTSNIMGSCHLGSEPVPGGWGWTPPFPVIRAHLPDLWDLHKGPWGDASPQSQRFWRVRGWDRPWALSFHGPQGQATGRSSESASLTAVSTASQAEVSTALQEF